MGKKTRRYTQIFSTQPKKVPLVFFLISEYIGYIVNRFAELYLEP